MATTIAVLSQKGGTGKTTTVRTLADVLRRLDLEVLCVDLDPQGNLSDYFDVPADADPTLADVLAGQAKALDAIHDGHAARQPRPGRVRAGPERQDGPRDDAAPRAARAGQALRPDPDRLPALARAC